MDKRGGDACGRIVGNICQKGTGVYSDYRDLIIDTRPPQVDVLPATILGHCRKASVGGKDPMYAQPIFLCKKDLNLKAIKDTQLKGIIKNMNNNDIIFSGIHNGTIENYKELARKYGVPIEEHNDSKVVLTALFYGNYDILAEYNGTAALMWQNHIQNKTYVFKGASKNWVSSLEESTERPLFCWNIGEENYYFSSTEDALKIIGAEEDKIQEVKDNCIYVFKDGVNVKSMKIDRSGATQSKVYSSDHKRVDGFHRPLGGYSKNIYEKAEEIYEESGIINRHYGHNNAGFAEALPNLPALWNDKTTKIDSKFIREFDCTKSPLRIQAEKNESFYNKNRRSIVFNKTRYWMNGGLMHGIYILNSSGCVPNRHVADAYLTKLYYFIEGVMIGEESAYRKAMARHVEFMKDAKDAHLDMVYLEDSLLIDIMKYSRHPIAPLLNCTGLEDCCYNFMNISSDPSKNFYSGQFTPYFSQRKYVFEDGNLKSIGEVKDTRYPAHTTEDSARVQWYLKKMEKTWSQDEPESRGKALTTFDLLTNPLSPFQTVMLDKFNLDTDEDIAMYFLHYLKDFDPDTRESCRFCISDDDHKFKVCQQCEKAEKGLKALDNIINYGYCE